MTDVKIGITMGDGAGIGPEVIVKAMVDRELPRDCRCVIVGDLRRLAMASRICRLNLRFQAISHPSEARFRPGTLDVIDVGLLPAELPFGKLSAAAGEAAYQYVRRCTELAQEGAIQAICTAPLNKEALHFAGHAYPGHTELLAELTGTAEVSMMLVNSKLRVIHVTTHIGLRDAIGRINSDLVLRTILRGHQVLLAAGIEEPVIAVCGINPHAGENGLFGYGEEEEKVVPAIDEARARGIDARGPLPADTVFFRAARGDFDLVVAMYHDQGHGPVKVMGLNAAANITVGLPIIRTSVDHGTAFDIAGSGTADARPMIWAISQAALLARQPAPVSKDVEVEEVAEE